MRRRSRVSLVAACLAIVVVALACQPPPPLGTVAPQVADGPQFPVLADPWVLPDSGTYYLYGTEVAGFRMPVYAVPSLHEPFGMNDWMASTLEAMPTRAPWARNDIVWAPTVAQRRQGEYVAFFAAPRRDPPAQGGEMCIGRAIASSPRGPFVPEVQPFSCGLDGVTGAIDPSLLRSPNGSWYLYAAFTNTPGWIYVFGLDENLDMARAANGSACCYYEFAVLSALRPWEQGWIENPAVTYDPATGTYLLAYSGGGSWMSANYSTGLARCSSPFGECTPSPGRPWLAKSTTRSGTGGLSFFNDFDGSTKVIYSSFALGQEWSSPRAATVADLSFGDWNPTIKPFADLRATDTGGLGNGSWTKLAPASSSDESCITGRDVTACLAPSAAEHGR